MSLTATLLHNEPEALRQLVRSLPKGRRRIHKIEDKAAAPASKKPSVDWRIKTTSAENCAHTLAAIIAGARTVRDIQDATGLGKTTIWRAVNQLEAWPTGPRIVRDHNHKPARFTAIHA